MELFNGAARIRILWMKMALTRPNFHLVDFELTKNKYDRHQMAQAKSQSVNNECVFTFQRRAGPFLIPMFNQTKQCLPDLSRPELVQG